MVRKQKININKTPSNSDTMKPINQNQERKINKVFIYIVIALSIAQILNIIINTL